MIFTIIACILGLLQYSSVSAMIMAATHPTVTKEATEARGCQYHPIRGAATVFHALLLLYLAENVNFVMFMMAMVIM
jgi:hypothetical protein